MEGLVSSDSTHHEIQLDRLRRLIIRRWWLATAGLWLTLCPLSLWSFRADIALLQQHFTWTSLRYALIYNRPAALGLALCIGLTVALLVGESRYLLFGFSPGERRRLEKQLFRIQQQGERHPLWRQVMNDRL